MYGTGRGGAGGASAVAGAVAAPGMRDGSRASLSDGVCGAAATGSGCHNWECCGASRGVFAGYDAVAGNRG